MNAETIDDNSRKSFRETGNCIDVVSRHGLTEHDLLGALRDLRQQGRPLGGPVGPGLTRSQTESRLAGRRRRLSPLPLA